MRESASGPASPAVVLLYEDDQIARQLMRDLLEEDGYVVLTASTLEDARDIAAAGRVDLFLAGLGESQRERALQRYRWCCQAMDGRIPAVILTGHDIAEVEVREIGCAAVLPKPFDIDELLRVVNNNLQLGLLEGGGRGAKNGSV